MPTGCCSSGGTCYCKLTTPEGSRFIITGSGQPNDPFVIDIELSIVAGDNQTFDTEITGSGSDTDPFVISTSYAPSARLDDIPDVNAPTPSNGQVLAWNAATSRWAPAAPTVAPTGAVQHDTTLTGDGSVGSPLSVVADSAHLVATWPAGVGLSQAGMDALVRHFLDATARTSYYASTPPRQNALSMLDTAPGVIEYWTGSAWKQQPNQIGFDNTGQFLALSGPWVNGLPVTVMVRQVSTTTDSLGVFDLLTEADLTGRSGVLDAQFQETGAIGWKALVFANTTKVSATAFRLTDGSLFASQPITGTVHAIVY